MALPGNVASRARLVDIRRGRRGPVAYQRVKPERTEMPDLIIVYWRDIPAQVIVGKGRAAAKVQLPVRFEKAIDRAAMASGAHGTSDYLEDWRRAAPVAVEGDAQALADAEAARLDAEYDHDRLKRLIANGGRD
jgi:hypothetical protein